MLVHKETMGVLDRYWTGLYRTEPDGVSVPVMEEFSMDDGFDPDQWWQVPRNSALGRRLRRCYPYCSPVIGPDGSLTGVEEWPRRRPDGQSAAPLRREAHSRQRRRRTGLLEHFMEGEDNR